MIAFDDLAIDDSVRALIFIHLFFQEQVSSILASNKKMV
jgi:hypothetical protein